MAPKISIIVPLSGGAAQALRCFEGIAAQSTLSSSPFVTWRTPSMRLSFCATNATLIVVRWPSVTNERMFCARGALAIAAGCRGR